jgi:hypothetical protein
MRQTPGKLSTFGFVPLQHTLSPALATAIPWTYPTDLAEWNGTNHGAEPTAPPLWRGSFATPAISDRAFCVEPAGCKGPNDRENRGFHENGNQCEDRNEPIERKGIALAATNVVWHRKLSYN